MDFSQEPSVRKRIKRRGAGRVGDDEQGRAVVGLGKARRSPGNAVLRRFGSAEVGFSRRDRPGLVEAQEKDDAVVAAKEETRRKFRIGFGFGDERRVRDEPPLSVVIVDRELRDGREDVFSVCVKGENVYGKTERREVVFVGGKRDRIDDKTARTGGFQKDPGTFRKALARRGERRLFEEIAQRDFALTPLGVGDRRDGLLDRLDSRDVEIGAGGFGLRQGGVFIGAGGFGFR